MFTDTLIFITNNVPVVNANVNAGNAGVQAGGNVNAGNINVTAPVPPIDFRQVLQAVFGFTVGQAGTFITFGFSALEDFRSSKEKGVRDTCEYMGKAPIVAAQRFVINAGHTNLMIGLMH
jgi:hypothetical protein